MLSIQQVRLRVLAHGHLGSGRGRVRRAAVHLGHALFVGARAADRDADRARHRRVHLRAVPGVAAAAARVPDRAAGRDSLDRLRPLGHLRAGARRARARGRAAGLAAAAAALQRAAARRRHAGGRADPRDHGHSVHLLGRARSAQVGAGGAARRRVRARRHALRSDPRGALLRAHRHRRRDHARLRPRARRDDGRHDGDRQQPAGLAVAVRAAVHDGGGHRERIHRSGRRRSTCTR